DGRAVDDQIHRADRRGPVGEPYLHRVAARGPRVADAARDSAANDVVAVDETGAGEAGVVGLDHTLTDRAVLGLEVGEGRWRSDLKVKEVDVCVPVDRGALQPDRVGARGDVDCQRFGDPGGPSATALAGEGDVLHHDGAVDNQVGGAIGRGAVGKSYAER